jgi:hypothetical protein
MSTFTAVLRRIARIRDLSLAVIVGLLAVGKGINPRPFNFTTGLMTVAFWSSLGNVGSLAIGMGRCLDRACQDGVLLGKNFRCGRKVAKWIGASIVFPTGNSGVALLYNDDKCEKDMMPTADRFLSLILEHCDCS